MPLKGQTKQGILHLFATVKQLRLNFHFPSKCNQNIKRKSSKTSMQIFMFSALDFQVGMFLCLHRKMHFNKFPVFTSNLPLSKFCWKKFGLFIYATSVAMDELIALFLDLLRNCPIIIFFVSSKRIQNSKRHLSFHFLLCLAFSFYLALLFS